MSKCLQLTLLGLVLVCQGIAQAEEVNVYSYRQPFLVEPLFERFTEASGIKVNVIFAKKGLAERLKREGRNSPADVVLTSDIGRLQAINEGGVTQAVDSATLNQHIPAQYRDPANHWFALTVRSRNFFLSKDRVAQGELTQYEQLADARWKGRICTRSFKHPYNIALTASMIAHHGADETRGWLEAVKANLARKPQGNDRAQVRAIKEGLCDVAIGNSYYYGKMLEDAEQKAWADAAYMVFPNQENRGTHVNISGMAMAAHAPNPANALKLMEFLAGETAQKIYAEQNYEYPVRPNTPSSGLVQSWGDFKADSLAIDTVAQHRAEAVRLINQVDFDG